jgi:hypothetical protein
MEVLQISFRWSRTSSGRGSGESSEGRGGYTLKGGRCKQPTPFTIPGAEQRAIPLAWQLASDSQSAPERKQNCSHSGMNISGRSDRDQSMSHSIDTLASRPYSIRQPSGRVGRCFICGLQYHGRSQVCCFPVAKGARYCKAARLHRWTRSADPRRLAVDGIQLPHQQHPDIRMGQALRGDIRKYLVVCSLPYTLCIGAAQT